MFPFDFFGMRRSEFPSWKKLFFSLEHNKTQAPMNGIFAVLRQLRCTVAVPLLRDIPMALK